MGVRRDKVRGIAVQFVLLMLLTCGLGASALFSSNGQSAARVALATVQECPDAEERAFLQRINRYRKSKGRKPLRLETQLMLAANHHSNDMTGMKVVDTTHVLSDGTTAQENLLDFGYPADTAYWGENIAVGTTWDTADEAFSFWRNSRGHNSNMLKKNFRGIGISRVYDATSTYTWYWTATFGSVVEETPTC